MRQISEIIVHCAATRPDWMQSQPLIAKVREIDSWHRGRGWSGIGYHYIIDRDGKVSDGRPLEMTGAHVKGRNTGTIGICLIGGHGSAETDRFLDNYTPEQDTALRRLIADLRRKIPSISTVSGHNQYAAKACPGFYVPDWYAAGAVKTIPRPSGLLSRLFGK